MQIHELPTFTGTPGASDYFAVDNGSITAKVAGSDMVNPDAMTVAEATAGTSTASRIVTPKVVHDYVTGEVSDGIDNITTSATETKWANITGGDGSINDALNYSADAMTVEDVPVTYTATTGSITSVECKKYGKIVHMRIIGKNTASTSAGANLFAGTISCDYLPAITAQSCAYSSGVAFPSSLTSAGALIVRSCATGPLASNVSVGASFVYITN